MGHQMIFVLLIFIVFNYVKISAKRRPMSKSEKIIGGEEVDIADYPYMARLILYNGKVPSFCGGSIISRVFILTAAHCVERQLNATVRIGSSLSDTGGRVYETDNFSKHPKYQSDKNDYDVGVVIIPNSMNFKGISARPIPLIAEGHVIPAGTIITVSGWGRTGEYGLGSKVLKACTTPVLDNKSCSKIFYAVKFQFYTLHDWLFCAGWKEEGTGFGKGDSGGPAVWQGVQVGIVSSAFGAGRPGMPQFYTNITDRAIRRWIYFRTGI